MGRMTEDMTRLRDEIIAGRGKRADFLAGVKDAVANLREVTVEMRADFSKARENMAADMKVTLEDAVEKIKDRVAELKEQSADMRQALRQTHGEMARDQRTERNAFITDLAGTVTTMLDGFLDARTSMSAEIQTELGAFCDGLKSDAAALQKETDDLLAAIRKAQARAARSSRKERLSFLADQVAFVNQFMDQVADMMDGLRRGQKKTAAEDRGSRQRFVSGLRTEVTDQQARFAQDRRRRAQEIMDQLRPFEEDIKLYVKELKAAVGIMRREFSDDLEGAKASWQGRKATAPLAKPPRPELEKEKPAQAEKKFQTGEPGALHLDQLTVIKGIGPRLQSKLYLAGIDTYAKLAKSDPAKLREILDQAARNANVENWIKQAKKLI
ncbi:MAG: hypothetical protein C4525_03315 [Desulfarculus sp.]|jgi:predicted flap endonuclease-1-like 5' DNA nuclease/prefoldin subunit 5|nr:MAG: hypothetical protein C4525_03315 [Desulfarculus sp.]